MVLGLKIRNQLLLMVILIIIFLIGAQSGISYVVQTNLDEVQSQKEEYLNRDSIISTELNDLVLETNEIIKYQLQEYIFAILHDNKSTTEEIFDGYRDEYENVLRLLRNRQNDGYSIEREELIDVPLLYEPDVQILNDIDGIVDKSTQSSAYSSVTSVQSRVLFIINQLGADTGELRPNYHNYSQVFNNNFEGFENSISQILSNITSLEESLITNTNSSYIKLLESELLDLKNELYDINKILTKAHINLYQSQAGSSDYLNIIDDFEIQSNNSANNIESSFNDLEGISSNTTHIEIIDNLELQIFNLTNSELLQLQESMGNFANVRYDIATFETSRFIESFEIVQNGVLQGKSIFDAEHDDFLIEYNKLQVQLTNDSQFAMLAFTAIVGIFAFLISTPTIFRIRSATLRLNRNFRKLADGDLSFKLRENPGDDEFGTIEQSFNQLTTSLRDIVGVVKNSSSRLAGISEELAAGTEEAASSINEVSSTVTSIASGASQQNNLISTITTKMDQLQRQIAKATRQIDEASIHVTKLSQRTNILGLNATISAAKAGEHGESFSIVADEIRKLSRSSKQSSVQISDLVDEITTRLRSLTEEIEEDIRVVRDVAQETAKGSEISKTSTSEQVIMIGEISESASDLAELANALNQILEQFTLE